ncbi:hypothetical protein [Caenimonas aquaedulcis]|uniref:Calcium-binding protein n=1 Tax=Caenimonas aquaedulcis TaxID=2793270 RepID=A0A931H4T4_9BURK|nr:hypothetical protein [Caenimonas aquaedulcis]MBG9388641.1 hypothetical protein [Caenimonas aquaedulcis]
MSSSITHTGEAGVNTTTGGDQFAPAIANLRDGFVVVWQSFQPDYATGVPSTDIYLQRYSNAGVPVGGEVVVNSISINEQVEPTVTATADGGFVVAWSSRQEASPSGDDYGVYLQRFDGQGNLLGTQSQVNTHSALDQAHPGLTALAGGGFVATWWSDTGAGGAVYSRVYGADGVAAGGETLVTASSAGPQSAPVTTGLADGGYVIAWDGSNGIHSQRFDSHGAAVSADMRVDTGGGGAIAKPAMAALADGGYAIAWQSVASDGNGLDIHMQRYAANGATMGGETLVNHTVEGQQTSPAITAMNDGGFVVAWTSTDGTMNGNDDIVAQRFDANGHTLGGETMLNSTMAGNQSDVTLAAEGSAYVAAWSSQGQDGSGWGVVATAVLRSDTAPLRSIVKATENSDVLYGTYDENACLALGGDDVYYSQGGADYFDGGSGRDTYIFPNSVSQVHSYTLKDGTLTIHTADDHYADTVPIIMATERIVFSDAVFALDTQGPSGSAPAGSVWQAGALLHAAFGTAPDMTTLSRWTAQADTSTGMGQLGQKLIDASLHGITSANLVSQVYFNLTGVQASAEVVASFTAQIGAGKTFATQGDALAYAANLSYNTDHLGFMGVVQQLDPTFFPHAVI